MKNSLVRDIGSVRLAAAVLRRGGLVGFPTETYYGLAADPFNPDAVAALFTVKQRPRHKPILTLIGGLEQLSLLVAEVPDAFVPLMERFWPGPLTLLFPAKAGLPPGLTAGGGTIGVRMSPHPAAVELISAFGGPVTATSANRSGRSAATTAEELRASLGDALDMIIDGGTTPGGPPSTIVGVGEDGGIVVARRGAVRVSGAADRRGPAAARAGR